MALRSTGLLASIRSRVSSPSHSPLSSVASSSTSPRLARAHSHSVAHQPRRDVIVDGVLRNPISPTAHLPVPPYTPLFPIYLPLTSISPTVPLEQAAESVIPLPRDIFGLPLRRDVLHQCVSHHQSLLKQGTKHVLNRSEVRGSGRKLFQQKGTGRARVGDAGSGIRIGGGATFGPRKRNFDTKLPRKVRQLGLKVAFSQKLREGKLWTVGEDGFFMDDWKVTIPRTHAFGPNSVDRQVLGASQVEHINDRLNTLGFSKPLFLHSPFSPPPSYFLDALKQIPYVRVEAISSVGSYDILKAKDIICDKPALEWLISTTRNYELIEKMDLYSGNAMVMRRRSLGLSDFPEEGAEDESKEMLRKLEEEALAGDGGPGGYEVWREKAVRDARQANGLAEEEVEEEELVYEEEEAMSPLDRAKIEKASWDMVNALKD